MDDFNWDSMGWSEWSQPVTDDNWDLNADFDWGSYDNGGYDPGQDFNAGGGGWDDGSYDWGDQTNWDTQGWSDWNPQPDSAGAWWSGAGDANSYALQQAGGYTAGEGQFGANGANGYDMGTTGIAPVDSGNGAITGGMGGAGTDEEAEKKGDAMLVAARDGNSGGPLGAVKDGFKATREFARENADLARLGIGVAGMFAARKDQKRSDQLMEQTLADRAREREMKEEMYRTQLENMRAAQGAQHRAQASQSSAVNRNNAQADYWNRQAQQSGNEARSLYNPQELGIRGYATEAAATGRAVQDTQSRMARQGKSQSAIDAEVRRAKVAGSTNASTGYMKGLDTGRSAQGGALTSAKGLGSNYTALASQSLPSMSMPSSAQSNADLAGYYQGQAGDNSAAIQDLLNYYLGDPLGTSNKNQVGV